MNRNRGLRASRRAVVVASAFGAAILLALDAPARPFDHATSLSVGPTIEMPLDARVYVMAAAGGRPQRVTPRAMLAFDPEWHPKSGALVIETEQGLVALKLGPRRSLSAKRVWETRKTLSPTMDWSPSFSPNGSELALVSGSDPDVWVLAPSSGRLRRLTTGWAADGFVDWSPAGGALAAVRQSRIFVLSPSGAVVRPLTGEDDVATLPDWSPAGRKIAFTRALPTPEVVVATQYGDVLWTIGGAVPTAYASWSPNGRSLAYSKFVEGSWDLFIRDLRSGRERRLTRTPYDEVDPVWSPDGRLLAFTGNERSTSN